MEDGVLEAESLLRSVTPAPPAADGAAKDNGEKESGFMSNLLSNLVPARESEEEKEEQDQDEEKGDGLLSNLISNLVSPVTSSNPVENGRGKVEDFEGKDEPRSGGEVSTSGEAGGGPIHSFINHLFQQKCEDESGKSQEESQTIKTVEKIYEPEKRDEEEDGGGGGLINSIVSHLPEDAAPSSDEASILIHSIVHD